MQNRFGFKDFVLLVVILVIGLLVVLQMLQADRVWSRIGDIQSKMSEIEQQIAMGGNDDLRRELSELKTLIATRPININLGGVSAGDVSFDSGGGAADMPPVDGERDESWARAGVPIDWQDRVRFSSQPKEVPGFRRGGEFIEIFGAQPSRITPYLAGDVYARRVTDRVIESMANYDPETLELRGVLAEAWQFDPDGRWLRVRIDPRARFSDGMPVTSEDVRWTFMDFIKNPLIEAERARATLDMIEDVKIIDEHSVEFVFNKSLFTNLAYTLGGYVLPKHFYSQFEPSQINQSTGLTMGSGHFRLERLDPDDQWTPGEDIVIVRNEQYWGDDPAPLASLRFKVISNSLASLVAFRNGEGDMLTPSSPQYAELRDDEAFLEDNVIHNWLNMRSGYSFIGWQCGPRGGEGGKLTPFHDPRVRRGMTQILDRELMIKDIWEGVGVVATGPNGPTSPASSPNVAAWPFDQDAADRLFAEAGWVDADGDGVREYQKDDGIFAKGSPFEFEFTITASGETAERVVSYLKTQCLKNGIVCTPKLVDWSYYTDMLKQRNFDAMIMGWSASAPESDPQQIWHSSSILDQADNFIQWANADADAFIEGGRGTLDIEARMQMWHGLHETIHEDQPYTFLRVVPWIRFVKNDIGNVVEYKTGLEPQEFFRAAAPTPGG
ncbi:MAG: ABC transporter substrate-binding protein [Planctomycetota bacterium]|nr:ABC transporter substrate-binding protein [Planctomycetota bacterium]